MNITLAKTIGRKKAFESVVIGLIVFYIIGILLFSNEGLQSLLWLSYLDLYNWLYILNWVITFFVLSYFIGNFAGKFILIKKKNPFFIGFLSGFFMIFFGACFGCLLGFFTEGIYNLDTEENTLIDYFLIPVFWIVVYGFVPSVLLGLFFGKRVYDFKNNVNEQIH